MNSARENVDDGWAIGIKGPFAVVMGLLLLGAFFYAVYTREVIDFLRFPIAISLGITVFLSMLMFSPFSVPKNFGAALRGAKSLLAIWILGAIVSLLLFGVGVSLLDAYRRVFGAMKHDGQFSLLVGITTLVLGASFFWLRTKWRVTYGISEAFAGVALASHRAYGESLRWTTSDFNFYAAVLTAGIYLVVRGFDNVSQGRNLHRDPMMQLANWLKAQTFTRDPDGLREMSGSSSVPPS